MQPRSLALAAGKPMPATSIPIVLLLSVLAGCGASDDPIALFHEGHYAEALPLFTRQADAGDLTATNYVGIHYYLGLGVQRDLSKAAQWFQAAALGENANAQRNLGVMYLRGYGVEKDYSRAYGWFYHAYLGGNRHAEKYLGFTGDLVTPNRSMQARKRVADRIKAAATLSR